MEYPILAFDPIYDQVDKIQEHGIPISFVFGDRDWADTKVGGTKVSKQLQDKGVKCLVLKDSDHNVFLDNPDDLLDDLDERMKE